MPSEPTPLPQRRAVFLLKPKRVSHLKKLVDPLKDAPLRARRLGLPLAVATWSRERHDALVQILSDWLFSDWGMLDVGSTPQGAPAFLNRLVDLDEDEPGLRSAIETEAEELLQAAKLLSGALTGERNG